MREILTKGVIRILGISYAIRWFNNNSRTDTAMGRADSKMAEINLCSGMDPLAAEETLLHESLHIISDNTHLGLTEQQISTLSACLYSMLVENRIITQEELPKPRSGDFFYGVPPQ